MQKSDWKKCKLGDVCSSSNTGLDAIRRAPIVEEDTGLKCLRIQDISQHKDFCLWGNTRVSDIDKEKFLIQKDDIFVARTGATVGCNYIVMQNFPAVFNNGLIRLKIKKDIEPLYVFYNLQGAFFRDYIRGIAFGTVAQPNIKIRDLLNFTLNLPPLEEQKRIAQILGSLDDKIELLQKQNKTLEDMAKAIFKSWFVDFDVVHAKQKGLPKADIMREYPLTDELYDLFPSDFENSSLGPIPLGWQVKKAQEIANITIGRTPPRKETEWFSTNSSDVTWISIKDLGNGSVFISDSSEYLTQEAVSKFRIPIIPAKTVVLSFKLTVNEAIAQFQDSSLPITYLYLLLKHINFSLLGSTSSIATAINSHTIKNMNMLVATKGILLAFDNQTQYLFNKIEENLKQIQTLTELRDTLLPPLISGKLRV